MLLGQESDGLWRSARWRVRGTLRGELPVQRFPFDRQTLAVVLELPERDGEGRPTAMGRVAFEVTLHRLLLTAATKLFLPLLVILLVAFVALFVHPKALDVRSGVGVTALLAAPHAALPATAPASL